MLTNENRSITTLMMLELLGTAFLLTVIALCVYFRRFFSKKSLDGCTALVGFFSHSIDLLNRSLKISIYQFPDNKWWQRFINKFGQSIVMHSQMQSNFNKRSIALQ